MATVSHLQVINNIVKSCSQESGVKKALLKTVRSEKSHLAYHVSPLGLLLVPGDKRRQTHCCCVPQWPSRILYSSQFRLNFNQNTEVRILQNWTLLAK